MAISVMVEFIKVALVFGGIILFMRYLINVAVDNIEDRKYRYLLLMVPMLFIFISTVIGLIVGSTLVGLADTEITLMDGAVFVGNIIIFFITLQLARYWEYKKHYKSEIKLELSEDEYKDYKESKDIKYYLYTCTVNADKGIIKIPKEPTLHGVDTGCEDGTEYEVTSVTQKVRLQHKPLYILNLKPKNKIKFDFSLEL